MIKHISTLTKEHILDTIQEFSRDNDKIIIISGFITLAGFQRIEKAIDPQKIDRIIVGVFTKGANRAFEYIAEEYPKIRLFIYKFLTKEGDVENPSFTPILHAKIIAGYKSRLLRWAYTGSANITDYALNNSNIESGIFLKHKNKELDEINKTIRKINNLKTNLIDFKKSEGLFFIPEEKFIHQVKAFKTVKVPNTYLVVINEELTDQNHDFIGIYCNDKDILARLRINDSILFYFL
jgi:hypothetical protein